MTEEDAKTKWCPFVRIMDFGTSAAGVRSAGVNRRSSDRVRDQHLGRCIGSACMAWRQQAIIEGFGPHGTPIFKAGAHGFCGLAGKPVP